MTAKEKIVSIAAAAGIPTLVIVALLGKFLSEECPPGGAGPIVDYNDETSVTIKNIPIGEAAWALVHFTDDEGRIGSASDSVFIYRASTRLFMWTRGDSLLHWWPFFEGSGGTSLDIIRRRTGTLHGPTWQAGRSIVALQFDGVDDRFLVDAPLDVDAPTLYLSAWIYPTGLGNPGGRIISKARSNNTSDHWWMLALLDHSRLRGRVKTSVGVKELVSDLGVIESGKWQLVELVYNGTTIRLYRDGALVAEAPHTGRVAVDPTVPVAIGNQPLETTMWLPFGGRIEDVRIGTATRRVKLW